MDNSLHITVAAVIEQHGRYLMVEEIIDGERVLNQPAGHLEAGESLPGAAVRETLEETAHPFTPTDLIGIYRWVAADGQTFVRFAFRGVVGEPEPDRALDPDIEKTLWLSAAEITARRDQLRSPMVLRCVQDAQQGHSYPLDLLKDLA